MKLKYIPLLLVGLIAATSISAQNAESDLSSRFLSNPHFAEDEVVVGGICTYDYDCEKNGVAAANFGMQPCTGWEPKDAKNGRAAGVFKAGSGAFLGSADFKVPGKTRTGAASKNMLGVVTCWSMSVQYTQTCTLPAGQYTLNIPIYNVGGDVAITKNLIGFIADDGTEYLCGTTNYPVGEWKTEEVVFNLDEETSGYFSIGYSSPNSGSAVCPHLFTDGFTIGYSGDNLPPAPAEPGDVNGDGNIDISDIVAVINQIAQTAEYAHADVNGDGTVDISDIVAIINKIAAGSGSEPGPEPEPVSVMTGDVAAVTTNSARVTGTVEGTAEAVKAGVVYGLSKDLAVTDDMIVTTTADGEFSVQLSSLKAGSTYYYRAFVEVGGEYILGDVKSFMTATATADITGTWVCTEKHERGNASYTITLNADKSAKYTSGTTSYDGSWSITDNGKVHIDIITLATMYANAGQIWDGTVNNVSNPTVITGSTHTWNYNQNGSSNGDSFEFEMTRK